MDYNEQVHQLVRKNVAQEIAIQVNEKLKLDSTIVTCLGS